MYAQILVRVWPKYMLNNVIYPGQVEWRRLRHEQIGQRRSLLFYAEEGKPTRDVRNFFAGGGLPALGRAQLVTSQGPQNFGQAGTPIKINASQAWIFITQYFI